MTSPGSVTVLIESSYACGHTCARVLALPAPAGPLSDWWDESVWPETGDGRHPSTAASYAATVVASTDPAFVGHRRVWE